MGTLLTSFIDSNIPMKTSLIAFYILLVDKIAWRKYSTCMKNIQLQMAPLF